MKVAGTVVLVTGASAGIGAACAAEFRRRGARLVLTGRNAVALQQSATPQDLVIAGDLTDARFRQTLTEQAWNHFGAIDVLINNAGVGVYGPASQTPEPEARAMFELNFWAAADLSAQAVARMRPRRSGTIVNVSSLAGQMTLPWFPFYSASKTALLAYGDALRMELMGSGLHVMNVCPGYVHTAFQDHVLAGAPPERVKQAKRFAIDAPHCARAIADGVERNARLVVTPSSGRWLVALSRWMPRLMEAQLSRYYRELEQTT